jgi:uncharacterized membrane protein required for colicin V production
MTILILALVSVAAGAAMGHRQGAIRATISLIGILLSAELAWPFSGLIKPILPHLGIHNPAMLWMLPPFFTFLVLLSIIKSIGLLVNRKVEVHYRYRADDLQFIRWSKMNRWLGLCIGLMNGMVYFCLISFVIYDFSYWTSQIATSSDEKWEVRLLNRMGQDLDTTGMNRVAIAINPLPELYFKTADLAGLLYQNAQLKSRLANYPPYLSLAESDEFKQLGQDEDFQGAWKGQMPIHDLINNGSFSAIWKNSATRDMVWDMVRTNLDDLQSYLKTGISAKYQGEPIYGRWYVNPVASMEAMLQATPDITTEDMDAMRSLWTPQYSNTVFIASADNQAFLENVPHLAVQSNPQPNHPPSFDTSSYQGEWKSDGYVYDVTLSGSSGNKSGTATIDGTRLTLKLGGDSLMFDR